MIDVSEQLAVLAELHALLQRHGIAYWLFGGWAVDFHVGRVTRPHGDLDVAVWSDDRTHLVDLLARQGWVHTPEAGEDGATCYARGGVRLEVAFLARDGRGRVYTPLRDGRAEWPDDAFGDAMLELLNVSAHVISLPALIADKSEVRDNPLSNVKDRADVASLVRRT